MLRGFARDTRPAEATALGRLDMIVEAAPAPEDVRAWLDHVTGTDAEAGPEVVALPPRMH